jgi:hypothetical protein
MPKFDWENFLGGFAAGAGKTGPEMYKDIRQQNIAQEHYRTQAQLYQMEIERKAREDAFQSGLKGPIPEPGWKPGDLPVPSGIGGPVAAGQLGVTPPEPGPMSLNAYEGRREMGTLPSQQAPAPAPVKTAPEAPRPAATLQDIDRRINEAKNNPLEQQRLLGQKAQLMDQQREEVNANLQDLNEYLRKSRDAEAGFTAMEQVRDSAIAKRGQLVALLKEGNNTPDQRIALENGIKIVDAQIAHMQDKIATAPALIKELDIHLERFTKMLIANGVDPEVIKEYRRQYRAGESGIGWLGRQIVTQGAGPRRQGAVPKGRTTPR